MIYSANNPECHDKHLVRVVGIGERKINTIKLLRDIANSGRPYASDRRAVENYTRTSRNHNYYQPGQTFLGLKDAKNAVDFCGGGGHDPVIIIACGSKAEKTAVRKAMADLGNLLDPTPIVFGATKNWR